MRKYVNGKILEMTEADIERAKSRSGKRARPQADTSSYETRIQELEDTVATLLAKLNETKSE